MATVNPGIQRAPSLRRMSPAQPSAAAAGAQHDAESHSADATPSPSAFSGQPSNLAQLPTKVTHQDPKPIVSAGGNPPANPSGHADVQTEHGELDVGKFISNAASAVGDMAHFGISNVPKMLSSVMGGMMLVTQSTLQATGVRSQLQIMSMATADMAKQGVEAVKTVTSIGTK